MHNRVKSTVVVYRQVESLAPTVIGVEAVLLQAPAKGAGVLAPEARRPLGSVLIPANPKGVFCWRTG